MSSKKSKPNIKLVNRSTASEKNTKTISSTDTSHTEVHVEPVVATKPNPTAATVTTKQEQDPNTIIAYVHSLSPLTRNKRNTIDYSTMTLQTASGKHQEALVYSKAKRSLLQESEESRTPVKIKKFTYTRDGEKVIVNEVTNISSPIPTEYNFQFQPKTAIEQQPFTPIKDITNISNEGDFIAVRGKVLELCDTVIVGNKLEVAKAVLADDTGTISLDLWQEHIRSIKAGEVYSFSPVQVRTWMSKKKISTIARTTITKESEHPLVTLPTKNASSTAEIKVQSIHSIEKVETFLQCVNCSRRIVQASTMLVRCDKCGHSMRTASCPKRRFAKVIIMDNDQQPIYITIFHDVLEKLNIVEPSDEVVAEALLLLDDIIITYDIDTLIVKDIRS